jgi:hypothetical protein
LKKPERSSFRQESEAVRIGANFMPTPMHSSRSGTAQPNGSRLPVLDLDIVRRMGHHRKAAPVTEDVYMNTSNEPERRFRMRQIRGWPAAFRNAPRPLRLAGISALALAAVLIIIGFILYGAEMGPHTIAIAAGILGEAALVVLVLDRVADTQRKHDWNFVRTLVSHGIAACMVDTVRLCCVRWSPLAYNADIDRYREFVQIARLDVANLRSNLEGLALIAEPRSYEQARRIERRLAWLADYLGNAPSEPAKPGVEFQRVLETVMLIGDFFLGAAEVEFSADSSAANSVVAALGPIRNPEESSGAADEFVKARYNAQTEILGRRSDGERGIWYDIDQQLAPAYFAIDHALFVRISKTIATASPT